MFKIIKIFTINTCYQKKEYLESMKKISPAPLGSLWLKASVTGSFWASVEIILGSFLHNLRFPMSGTILSFISVFILVSFTQIWKEKGLMIRAGMICALMKSISPSAVILGPMTGIFIEALLLEFSVRILGMNIAGYLLGGALAVMSTLLHKLVSLLIMFGFDFIKILDMLYQFSVKQVNIRNADPMDLIMLITLIYAVTGMAGAAAGFLSGKRYLASRHSVHGHREIVLDRDNDLFPRETGRKYSIILLIIIFLAIVAILLLINLNMALPATVLSIAFVVFCLLHYRSSLNRLKKLSLWFQFAIITLIAAFLWNGVSEKNLFSYDGLLVGLKMVARATIVVIGFAAISAELKNPLVKSILYKKGFRNLYRSLTIAFSALPGIITGLPKAGKLFGKSGISFPLMYRQAESLLQTIENEHMREIPVIIVTGERGQGKTTWTRNVTDSLKKMNFRISGFLSPGVHNNEERTGFNILDLKTSAETELCTIHPYADRFRYGKYYFNPEGLAKGNEILRPENVEGNDLVVIDEIGPVELNDEGWAYSVNRLINYGRIPQLWVVRQSLVENVIKKWIKGDIYIFNINEDSPASGAEKIMEIISVKGIRNPEAK